MAKIPCFTWIIENIPLCKDSYGEPILSPSFQVDRSSKDKFYLEFHLRSPHQTDIDCHNSVLLFRRFGNQIFEIIKINYRFEITIRDGRDRVCKIFENSFTNYDEYENNLEYFAISLPMNEILSTSTLLIKCIILDYVAQPFVSFENLKELSSSFANLFNEGIHFDIQISVQNKKYKAHKAILEARFPSLVTKYREENGLIDFTVDDVDAETFGTVLKYLYTGTIEGDAISKNLHSFLDTNEIPHLKNYLSSTPFEILYQTKFVALNFIHYYFIDNFTLRGCQGRNFSKTIGNDNHSWSLMQFNLIYSPDMTPYRFPMVYIKREHNDKDIVCRFQITVQQNDNNQLVICDHVNHFKCKKGLKLPLKPEFEYWWWKNKESFLENDVLALQFEIDVGIRGHSTSTLDIRYYDQLLNTPPLSFVKEFKALQVDFKQLFQNRKFSDVIFTVGEQKLFAHKSILSARSEVFRKMFEHPTKENLTGEVVIVDMDLETVSNMLQFLYCAEIEYPKENEKIIDLYFAAHKYQISKLVKECSRLVLNHLSADNFGDILDIADKYDDALLTNGMVNFILRNPEVLVHNIELKMVINSYPNLLSRVLEKALDYIIVANNGVGKKIMHDILRHCIEKD